MGGLTRRQRIEGGLVGLLVGDALGVPYEFHPPDEIPPRDRIEFEPPPDFDRSHPRVPPGTWSDDGAQALCLLASLLHVGQLNITDFSHRLVNWYEYGYLAVDNLVFDVGIQTGVALRALSCGYAPEKGALTGEHANGNGSLMRVLPLALWHGGADDILVEDAFRQSSVTHGHKRAQMCCALYCLWARRILEENPEPWNSAVATLREMFGEHEPERAELEFQLRPHDDTPGRGSGYVVDCLRSARDVVHAHRDYESTVKAAVALGRDTDTTACVAGGIAGLLYGVDGIPVRWRSALRGRDLLGPLLQKVVDRI